PNSPKLGRGSKIRTCDPRFPKPVLYQAELYPDARCPLRLHILSMLAKACYRALSGIPSGGRAPVFHAETRSARVLDALRLTPGRVALVLGLGLAAFLLGSLLLDAPVSEALQAWPAYERAVFARLTRLGQSDWILIPSALIVIVAAVMLRTRIDEAWRQAMLGLLFG